MHAIHSGLSGSSLLKRLAPFTACLALLAGCNSLPEAQMALPDDLAQAERVPVMGRQGSKIGQELAFGQYYAYDVQRGITKGGDLKILAYDQSRRRQVFSFRVADDDGHEWIGDCEALLRRKRLATDSEFEVNLQNASQFAARLSPTGAPDEAWILRLAEEGERPLSGELLSASRTLEVRGTNRMAGSPLPLDEATGFVVFHESKAIAAAEVINDGAIWIHPDLEPELRGPVAACLTALLLFEELRPTLDN